MTEEEIDKAIARLSVKKMRKSGKYSMRKKDKDKQTYKQNRSQGQRQHTDQRNTCPRCRGKHEPHRCPARGKECFECDGQDHFANTPACPLNKKSREYTTKRVESYYEEVTEEENSDQDYGDTLHLGRIQSYNTL